MRLVAAKGLNELKKVSDPAGRAKIESYAKVLMDDEDAEVAKVAIKI